MWALPLLLLYLLLTFTVCPLLDPTTCPLGCWEMAERVFQLCFLTSGKQEGICCPYIHQGQGSLPTRYPPPPQHTHTQCSLYGSVLAPSDEERKPKMLGPPGSLLMIRGVSLRDSSFTLTRLGVQAWQSHMMQAVAEARQPPPESSISQQPRVVGLTTQGGSVTCPPLKDFPSFRILLFSEDHSVHRMARLGWNFRLVYSPYSRPRLGSKCTNRGSTRPFWVHFQCLCSE